MDVNVVITLKGKKKNIHMFAQISMKNSLQPTLKINFLSTFIAESNQVMNNCTVFTQSIQYYKRIFFQPFRTILDLQSRRGFFSNFYCSRYQLNLGFLSKSEQRNDFFLKLKMVKYVGISMDFSEFALYIFISIIQHRAHLSN